MSTTPIGVPDSGFLVGDVIMDMRVAGPDLPQAMGAPVTGTITPTTGGSFVNGTYFFVVTISNQWGESVGSIEQSVTLAGPNNAFTVVVDGVAGGAQPLGTFTFKVYFGVSAGGENAFQTFTGITLTNTTLTVTNVNVLSGFPPARSTAYLPDTDGGFSSAYVVFRWLHESLRAISKIAGGVQDMTGVASVSGQRRYAINGQWLKIDHAWYDGWEQDQGTKADAFYNRNLTANISISLMVDARADKTRIELYWTPSRTSGSTTTGATLNATDANVTLAAPAVSWLLQDGFAQVGSEIISYSAITSTQLQNISRGWGGTQTPTTLASPASVNELNIMLAGYRQPTRYPVGTSASIVGVPSEWQPALNLFMLSKFRMAEQAAQEAQALYKQAEAYVRTNCMTNRQVAGPRQCRVWDDRGIRGLTPGGLSGGIIIP